MKNSNLLALIFGSMGWLLFAPVYADSDSTSSAQDSFNRAVNHYLDGFVHCTQANEALRRNNTDKAQQEFARYKSIKSAAAKIDKSILTSSERGMESNILYCQRVATDLEIALGKPLMDNAFSQCEKAKTSLDQGDQKQAQIQYQAFESLKDKAITSAPSLETIFSVKNQIWKCERLETKIAQLSNQQLALDKAIESATKKSSRYIESCQTALVELRKSAPDRDTLNAVNAKLNNTISYKQAALADAAVWASLQKPQHQSQKKTIEDKLKLGDQCASQIKNTINAKLIQIGSIELKLKSYSNTLNSGLKQCNTIISQRIRNVTPAALEQAKGDYRSALKARNRIRSKINDSDHKARYSDWPQTRLIHQSMQQLNACLDTSKTHLNKLALASPAKPTQAKADIPLNTPPPGPKRFQGSIHMEAPLPDFALVYLLDGSSPPQDVEVVLDQDGFTENLYVVANGDTFAIKSKAYGRHRITAEVPNLNFTADITQLQARQHRSGKVSWPDNTIATLRSNRGDVLPTYMASIPSGNYQLITLDKQNFSFELKNPAHASKGYFLLPGYDPLEINVAQGEFNSLTITRNAEASGSLQIKNKN
ncbi:hypothetical protein FT643_18675 [Ketobacter sp. MCCC 1A13808]|uniref:hypothetical protein n=1 Tax=Ketobacter sp. MCCC 1A13808 TaxID=2602738 RepID=UPI0012ECB534|nr:hypothetical protein [Ketobacter sp. MCCC 1A13808]MVF14166.1 hypothetical protein [Ketobacter sp. MCCC 1A13808]